MNKRAGFFVGGFALGVLLLNGCGRSESANESETASAEDATRSREAASTESSRAEEPELPPIRLAPLPTVTLQPGEATTVILSVERNGHEGPVQVETVSVPDGVTATADVIDADLSEGELALAAAPTLGDEPLAGSIELEVRIGEQTARSTLAVEVPRVELPTFLPVNKILLQPGSRTAVDLQLQRNGYAGPLELKIEGVPDRVICKVANLQDQQASTTLEIETAEGVPDKTYPIRVVATLLGREVDVKVPLQVVSRPFEIDAFRVVTLAPGQTQQIQLPLTRRGFSGPVELSAVGLPPGVTVQAAPVAAEAAQAELQFATPSDAAFRVASAEIVATAGRLSASSPIVIRVGSHDDNYLPAAITANREIGPLLRRGSIGGRLTLESRQALLDFYGGTEESEAAVMRGLRWLAAHQQLDGSWPLNDYAKGISGCDCQTEFENAVDDSLTAGTAFGILPFLGVGVTHDRSPEDQPELKRYQRVVEKGLVYLAQHQTVTRDKKDKQDGYLGGSMYAHALGTIAFCEAYGLSGDEDLKGHAQLAIKYLLNAQHDKGGGWRYSTGQAGDMSVTGWVFLAIRSAQLTGFDVLRAPLLRAERFVDSCAAGPEEAKLSRYAYQPGQKDKLALSAAGLLTRQYLGWKEDHPQLLAGGEYLMQHLPNESDTKLGTIYFYYYATQVLHHLEGSDFDLWNHRMREHLIHTQERTGHATGSWNPQGTDYGGRGGRLYATSMALLTLQVYYRHLPMYRYVKRT